MIRGLRTWQKIALAFFIGAIVGPFVPLAVASVSFRWGWPDLLPSIWWWEKRESVRLPLAWDYVFDPVSRLLPALQNTVLIAVLVTVVALLFSIPAARVLARHRFAGKPGVELLLSTPLIVPEIAFGIGMLLIFLQFGLQGNLFAVAAAHLIPVLPYMIRVLTSVYTELDKGMLEQAELLGASRIQVFWFIEMPLMLPGILAAALFSVLISTNIFLLTFYIGQGQVDTLATLLFTKISGGGALDPVAAAFTLIITVPGLLFLAFSQRVLKEEVFASGISRS
ncbi:ABC transporter permease [Sneathiella sp.]|jgi:putative spermidine/putrescine transport system permease protein|uniref:ABC transporter permease n=1 Tax=Sneathiella sp. TaxID=1964365 RepID=UPI0039E2D3C7